MHAALFGRGRVEADRAILAADRDHVADVDVTKPPAALQRRQIRPRDDGHQLRDAALRQLLQREAHDETVQPCAAKIGMREAVRHVRHVGGKRHRGPCGLLRRHEPKRVATERGEPIAGQRRETDFAPAPHALRQRRVDEVALIFSEFRDFIRREKAECELRVRTLHFCDRFKIQPHDRVHRRAKHLVEHDIRSLCRPLPCAKAFAKRIQAMKDIDSRCDRRKSHGHPP